MKNSEIAYYRLDLIDFEMDILQKYFNTINESKVYDEDKYYFNSLIEKIQNPKKIKLSYKKSSAALDATRARSKKAKDKIENAMNILRMENKKMTYYSIAKNAGVSYSTVKKYITLNEID